MEMNGNVGKQTKQRKNKIKKEGVKELSLAHLTDYSTLWGKNQENY